MAFGSRSTHRLLRFQGLDKSRNPCRPVGLAAAIAMNCTPCTKYYISKANDAGIEEGAISEVLAKVMAVAAGQKKLQTQLAINKTS